MSTYPYINKLIADAVALGGARVAVAYPLSVNALEAAAKAHALGVIDATLVGPRTQTERLAADSGLSLEGMSFVDTPDNPHAAAAAAVAMARDGQAAAIMKGSLHTDELLGAVVNKEKGLRTGRRTSHVFVFDVPGHGGPLMMADCVVNIQPDLMAKRDIIQNAIELAHGLAIARPKVAVLSAVETINPAIPGTLEAAALSKMADRGQITGAIVDGPLAFDNAISAEAARIKGINSPVAGAPDILIVPNLEAGNMLYKQLVYLGKAECAGLILGTRAPVILTSRADSELCRIASAALAVIHASATRPRA